METTLNFDVVRDGDGKKTVVTWFTQFETAEEACKRAGLSTLAIGSIAPKMRELAK